MTLFNLARQNMRRRLSRTLVVLVAVGLATGTLFTATILLWGVERGIRQGKESLGADVFVIPLGDELDTWTILTGKRRTTGLEEIIATKNLIEQDLASIIAKIEGVEAVTPQLYLSTWKDPKSDHCTIVDARIIGYDPGTDFILKPLLENKLNRPQAKDEIIVGSNLIPSLEEGERVYPWKVYGADFAVIGRVKPTGTALDFAMFIPLEGIHLVVEKAGEFAGPEEAASLNRIKPGFVSSFLIRTKPQATPEEVAGKIRAALPAVSPVMVSSATEMVTSLSRQFYSILQNLFHLGLSFLGMSILVVAAIFTTIVYERRREVGLLRAMGATSRSIFKLIIYESTTLTGFGGAAGVGLGAGIIYYLGSMIQSAMKMPYVWPAADRIVTLALTCLAAGVGAGLLGALHPAVRSSRMEPLTAIRTGE